MNIVAKYIKEAHKVEAKNSSQFLVDAAKILPMPEFISSKYNTVEDRKNKAYVLGISINELARNLYISNDIFDAMSERHINFSEVFKYVFYNMLTEIQSMFESSVFLFRKNELYSIIGIRIAYRTYPLYLELKHKNVKNYEEAYDEVDDPDVKKDIIMTAFKKGDLYYVETKLFKEFVEKVRKQVKTIMSDRFWSNYVKQEDRAIKEFEAKHNHKGVLKRLTNFLEGLKRASFEDIMRG